MPHVAAGVTIEFNDDPGARPGRGADCSVSPRGRESRAGRSNRCIGIYGSLGALAADVSQIVSAELGRSGVSCDRDPPPGSKVQV
jgi:hypothetical protein